MILLRGACRSHRQLEFSAVPRIESTRKLRDGNSDSNNSDQSQNVVADDVHDGILAKDRCIAKGSVVFAQAAQDRAWQAAVNLSRPGHVRCNPDLVFPVQ